MESVIIYVQDKSDGMEKKMKLEFDVKLTANDLFLFNIKQAYRGMQGILSIILPILVFAYAKTTWGEVSIGSTLVYVGLGILFLVYVPISLWLRVNKSIKDPNNALSKTLHYVFSEKCIQVSVEAEQVEFQWENIFQLKKSGKQLLIYTNRINAYILPLEQLHGKYEELAKLAHTKLDKHRISMN